MKNDLETAVAGLLVAAVLWLYGALIMGKLAAQGRGDARRIGRLFQIFGTGLAIACFVVGLLYRSHVITLTLAAICYAPLTALFLLGLRWLQPFLRAGKGDSES